MPIDKIAAKVAIAEHERGQKKHNAKLPRAVHQSRPLSWLAQNKIALRNVHILAAPPGAGASCLLTHWVAKLSRGDQLLPGHDNEKGWGACCYMQLGHDIARVEYPRLEAAEADKDQVIVIPEDDIYEADDILNSILNLSLLVVDADHLAIDEGRTLRGYIEKLETIAKQRRLAVILMAKLPVRRAEADRRLEELCLIPQVSVVFTIERRAEDRVLRTIKNRIGNDEDVLRFRLVARELKMEGETAPVVEWLVQSDAGFTTHRYTELEKCIEWVRRSAIRGMRSTVLYELADQSAGFSGSTVRRALEPAGYKSCMITGVEKERFAVILHLLDDPKLVIDKGMLAGATQLDDDQEL